MQRWQTVVWQNARGECLNQRIHGVLKHVYGLNYPKLLVTSYERRVEASPSRLIETFTKILLMVSRWNIGYNAKRAAIWASNGTSLPAKIGQMADVFSQYLLAT